MTTPASVAVNEDVFKYCLILFYPETEFPLEFQRKIPCRQCSKVCEDFLAWEKHMNYFHKNDGGNVFEMLPFDLIFKILSREYWEFFLNFICFQN